MNVFLACFLGCIFALSTHHIGFSQFTRWRMRRHYERFRKENPNARPILRGPIPDFKPPKCFVTCEHCTKEFEIHEDKVRIET